MDRILIEGLACRCHVGVPESERRRRQRVLIDLELELALGAAGRSDRVDRTIDYAAAALEVKRFAEGRPFRLVEHMAEGAARRLLGRFGPERVRVRIRKFSVPGAGSVGVEVVRSRRSGKSRRRSGFPRAGPR